MDTLSLQTDRFLFGSTTVKGLRASWGVMDNSMVAKSKGGSGESSLDRDLDAKIGEAFRAPDTEAEGIVVPKCVKAEDAKNSGAKAREALMGPSTKVVAAKTVNHRNVDMETSCCDGRDMDRSVLALEAHTSDEVVGCSASDDPRQALLEEAASLHAAVTALMGTVSNLSMLSSAISQARTAAPPLSLEDVTIAGTCRKCRKMLGAGKEGVGHHVRFNLDQIQIYEVTPYSEVYGLHPRLFNFDKRDKDPPSWCFIAGPDAHSDSDSNDESDSDDEEEDEPQPFISRSCCGKPVHLSPRKDAAHSMGYNLGAQLDSSESTPDGSMYSSSSDDEYDEEEGFEF